MAEDMVMVVAAVALRFWFRFRINRSIVHSVDYHRCLILLLTKEKTKRPVNAGLFFMLLI